MMYIEGNLPNYRYMVSTQTLKECEHNQLNENSDKGKKCFKKFV